ncbi:MAG: CDP-alcohol phosphatidyltransferase family protein [Deltaproteobacteria bacterium]|nr:CDP-alcohol phosphatidyltransferase family protein [Deltaproteobacteria bacterium]
MILVPVFLYLVVKDLYYAAGAVFAIAGISDSVDGFIAKRYKLQTEFGALLDPIADKLMLSTAYVVLALKDIIPIWLAVPVVLRDLLMLSIALVLRLINKKFEPKPTPFGKVSTILQVITAVYALGVYKILGAPLLISLIALTTVFTIYSAIDYAITGIRMQSKTGK